MSMYVNHSAKYQPMWEMEMAVPSIWYLRVMLASKRVLCRQTILH